MILSLLPGITLTTLCAFLVIYISGLSLVKDSLHLSPLIIAIILGALLRNFFALPAVLQPGITFSLKKILRLAIILLGFKISLQEIHTVGLKGFAVISISLVLCYFFTYWLGKKLGLGKKLALLLASGISICGASAIIATDAIIRAKEEDCAFAVGIITVYGTIAMFLYPLLNYFFQINDITYAIWAGASIHEVAQVVVAGFSVSDNAGKLASLVKLTRVAFMIPVSIALIFWNKRENQEKAENGGYSGLTIPWFIFGFLAMIILNSSNLLSRPLTEAIIQFDTLLLTIVMVALGLETNFNKIRAAGIKPIYTGLFASLFISLLALAATLLLAA